MKKDKTYRDLIKRLEFLFKLLGFRKAQGYSLYTKKSNFYVTLESKYDEESDIENSTEILEGLLNSLEKKLDHSTLNGVFTTEVYYINNKKHKNIKYVYSARKLETKIRWVKEDIRTLENLIDIIIDGPEE